MQDLPPMKFSLQASAYEFTISLEEIQDLYTWVNEWRDVRVSWPPLIIFHIIICPDPFVVWCKA